MALTSASPGISLSSTATAGVANTVTNDDGYAISISDATIVEGNSGTSNAQFTVTLTPNRPLAFTVTYNTSNGTATSGSDYVSTSGSLSMGNGTTSKVISIPVVGDTIVESDEYFSVNIGTTTTDISVVDTTGIGLIQDDENGVSLAIIDNSADERGTLTARQATYRVSRTGSTSSQLLVQLRVDTSPLTSADSADYTLDSPGGITGPTQVGNVFTIVIPAGSSRPTRPSREIHPEGAQLEHGSDQPVAGECHP